MYKLLALLVLFLTIPGAFANELEDRQVISDEVKTLFLTSNYSELDRLASSYLKKEERTSSGLWKLTLFYAGISMLPNSEVTTEKYWNDLEARANNWIKVRPKSPSGYLTYAEFLMRHAWMYRGDGFNYQVRREDWKPFEKYVEKARVVLESCKDIGSKDPEWYVLMIDVATAQNWDAQRFHALLDEATTNFPFYYQIYFEAVNYLTPKWHGSKKEIEDFANQVVTRTSRKEKSGMYARIYWVASQANYGSDLFTSSDVVWGKMSKAIDDVIEMYPDEWNINNFAYFSCLAGDAHKANKLIRMIDGKPIISAWHDINFFMQCKAWSDGSLDKKAHYKAVSKTI